MVRIRLRRGGRKNLPAYSIVVMEQKFRRDGKSIEVLGYYQPTQPTESEYHLKLNKERYLEWKSKGAQPSATVQKLAAKLGFDTFTFKETPIKSAPGKKMLERAKQA